MSTPWVNGTVEAVETELRKSIDDNPGCCGIEYAAATGMITGLAHDYSGPRPAEARIADIVTVLTALERITSRP